MFRHLREDPGERGSGRDHAIEAAGDPERRAVEQRPVEQSNGADGRAVQVGEEVSSNDGAPVVRSATDSGVWPGDRFYERFEVDVIQNLALFGEIGKRRRLS